MRFAQPKIRTLKGDTNIMALMKWTSPKEIERLFEGLFENHFFLRMWRRFPKWKGIRESEEISPSVDMYDKKDEIVIKAEIPGVEKEDINISLMDNTLIIRG